MFTRQLKIQNAFVLTFMAVEITGCEVRGEGVGDSRLQTEHDCFGLEFESHRLIFFTFALFSHDSLHFGFKAKSSNSFQESIKIKSEYYFILNLARISSLAVGPPPNR